MDEVVRITLSSPTETFSHRTAENSAIKIGRSSTCDFVIVKDDLSREHCLLEIGSEGNFITDLGSKNGLTIDRVRIPAKKRVKINEGALVVLANIYTLKINSWEIKTRSDLILKKHIKPEPAEEILTATFELDMDTALGKTKSTAKKARKKEKKEEASEEPKKYENVKMVVAFAAVVAFILYQALGR